MIHFLQRLRRLLALFLLAATLVPVQGQPECDSLRTATFAQADLGGYVHAFTPDLPDGASTIFSTEWGFLGEDFTQFSLSPQPQVTFPGIGDYLVCLRAGVLDDQQMACTSVHCELVHIPVDSACAGLQPGFTIVPQGGDLQFVDQTVSDQPVSSQMWDFGDGSTSTETSPVHEYAGAGPYQACLTTSTGPCTASACNWIYLGPTNVPCDTLLHAAIGVIQYERTIAVFDQSITSGMNSSVHWNFGDGEIASGSPVIHTYAADGDYEVCGMVGLWGPLTPDTCVASACQEVFTGQSAAVVTEHASGPSLRAHPVPFTDAVTIEGAEHGASWDLLDLLGRVRSSGIVPSSGTLIIDGRELDAGPYFLRCRSDISTSVVRVLKE